MEARTYASAQAELGMLDLVATLDSAPAQAKAQQAAAKKTPGEVCLELDDHALALLCALALPHNANMRAVRLVPCLGAVPVC